MRLVSLLLSCLIFALPACASPHGTDPDGARLVTDDLARFWSAWDAAEGLDFDERAHVFDREYLDKGTPGLKAFDKLRIQGARDLVAQIDRYPRYYASLRDRMDRLEAQKADIRESLRSMHKVYPDAVFPDVYSVIGRMSSAGTLDDTGLLIGLDMFGRGEGAPLDELGDWHRAVVGEFDRLPAIVAHEWVHFQQDSPIFGQPTLLQAAIGEGVADFIAELGTGRHINHHVHDWAEPRAAALWEEFRARMDGTDYAGQVYEGANARGGRPADLGYWNGYCNARPD